MTQTYTITNGRKRYRLNRDQYVDIGNWMHRAHSGEESAASVELAELWLSSDEDSEDEAGAFDAMLARESTRAFTIIEFAYPEIEAFYGDCED